MRIYSCTHARMRMHAHTRPLFLLSASGSIYRFKTWAKKNVTRTLASGLKTPLPTDHHWKQIQDRCLSIQQGNEEATQTFAELLFWLVISQKADAGTALASRFVHALHSTPLL